MVETARVYDDRSGDGTRVLVDRLWPRGMRKDDPRIDQWLRDVAPSTELRKWYGHEPELFDEFARRYEQELESADGAEALERLRAAATDGPITLVTATGDLEHSHVVVLARLLSE